MSGSGRVLSVSFGDFRCTLEGFEDPVAAIMGVAEVVRGFGSEPPAPDAGLLARIVAQEEARGIAARVDGTDLVLRACGPEASPKPPAAEAPALPLGHLPAAEAPDLTERIDRIHAAMGPLDETGVAVPEDAGDAALAGEDSLDAEWAGGWDDPVPEPAAAPEDNADEEFAQEDPAAPATAGAASAGVVAAGAPDDMDEAGARDAVGNFMAALRLANLVGGSLDAVPSAAAPGLAGGARRLLDGAEDGEAAIARILSRTDEQLAEPESSRRREAVATLKAAVAATEAARRLGEAGPGSEDPASPFRDDMEAVRPRRPVATGEAARPPRPAPLQLTPSQRVDGGARLPASGPVRPRRVTPEPVPAVLLDHARADGFAAFAAAQGAHEPMELIEAAAAHATFVAGAADVSRPEALGLARLAREVAREDALRCWDALVHAGRLVPVGAGRFQVSADSRFNPAG